MPLSVWINGTGLRNQLTWFDSKQRYHTVRFYISKDRVQVSET